MSLADHIRQQEQRAQELQEKLDALAAEYAEQMRAFGVEPIPVVDTTGPGEHYSDGPEEEYPEWYTTFACRTTGIEAWRLDSSEMVRALFLRKTLSSVLYELAITTTGGLLVGETCAYGRGDIRVQIGGPDPYPCFVYREADRQSELSSWQEAREKYQRDTLIAWAERAHIEGLGTIVLPIEHAMLHEYNRLRMG
jgi:hypothetical protein